MNDPVARGAPLVVFDFDHTLYNGDSGSQLVAWLLLRHPLRLLLALLLAPVAGPLIAFLRTRRFGISALIWAATVGAGGVAGFERDVREYVESNAKRLQARLLPAAMQVLHRHRQAGDFVVVATGAPVELARAILAFVAHEDLPVIGTQMGPRLGGVSAWRHCHHETKMDMLGEYGFDRPIDRAYSDSLADLPLLLAARHPVVVNPKPAAMVEFRRRLRHGTPVLNWGCPGRGGALPEPSSGNIR